MPLRTFVRYSPTITEDLAAQALQRLDDLEAALEPLGLAEVHRPKFFAVRYQVDAWERTRMAREGRGGA